jgi:hypothetical protein
MSGYGKYLLTNLVALGTKKPHRQIHHHIPFAPLMPAVLKPFQPGPQSQWWLQIWMAKLKFKQNIFGTNPKIYLAGRIDRHTLAIDCDRLDHECISALSPAGEAKKRVRNQYGKSQIYWDAFKAADQIYHSIATARLI